MISVSAHCRPRGRCPYSQVTGEKTEAGGVSFKPRSMQLGNPRAQPPCSAVRRGESFHLGASVSLPGSPRVTRGVSTGSGPKGDQPRPHVRGKSCQTV